jgi:hypothetical protein
MHDPTGSEGLVFLVADRSADELQRRSLSPSIDPAKPVDDLSASFVMDFIVGDELHHMIAVFWRYHIKA